MAVAAFPSVHWGHSKKMLFVKTAQSIVIYVQVRPRARPAGLATSCKKMAPAFPSAQATPTRRLVRVLAVLRAV